MSKIWLIARREYLYNLRRPAFLWGAFGTPLFIIAIWAVVFIFLANDTEENTFDQVGYVDPVGVINTNITTITTDADSDEPVVYTFAPFESAETAAAALENDTIDAYYVLAEDYLQSGAVQRFAEEAPPDGLNSAFRQLLVQSLSADLDLAFPAARVLDPVDEFNIKLLDTGRVLQQEAIVVLFLLPTFFAILFSIATQTTGSFLMGGLVEEKTNRILEILVTTLTPTQLLLGKVIGLGLLGLSQITVWIVAAGLILGLGPQIEALAFLQGLSLPLDLVVIGVIYFVLGYFFNGSILAAIGVLAGTVQQSNQYAGIVNLTGYLIPLLLLTQFIENSNGTVPVLLSIIPITAPVSMIIRVGLGAVPFWQLALSIGLLFVLTVFVAWAAGKVFRWGLLMYGKRFTVRDLASVIFGRREMGVTAAQSAPNTAQEGA